MTIIVACEGQLTRLVVVYLTFCLGFFFFEFSAQEDPMHASNKKLNKDLPAASCQKLNSMKALITRKCAVKNFLSWNVLIFFVHPGK